MNRLFFITLLIICSRSLAQSSDETMFFSVDAAVNAGFVPWKSFGAFRREYNKLNDTTLKSGMGGLSDQYGFDVGADFFIANHLVSAVDFSKTYGKAKAVFDNGAERIIKSDINMITASIGWLNQTERGYWSISSGFSFAFGILKSSLIFPDGTRYSSTGGLSGEFHDVSVGVPLKFELARNLSERIMFKVTLQGNYYFMHLEDGMQNIFITGGESALTLNNNAVKLDISGVHLSAGLTFKLFSE